MDQKEGVTIVKEASNQYIKEYTLNSFKLRILDKINALSYKVDTNVPLWEGPIKMCQRIEQNPLSLDTVVQEAKKYNTYFYQSGSENPVRYHAVLCRVYILLYYRHHGKEDEEKYHKFIIPTLKDHMGVYASKYLNTINQQIDDILEMERLAASWSTSDGGKSRKPLTAPQARLFCEVLLEELNRAEELMPAVLNNDVDSNDATPNKAKKKKITLKDNIAPLASKLFGHTPETIMRAHSYEKADREYIAGLFKEYAPEFSKLIMSFGKTDPPQQYLEMSKKAGTQKKKE